MTATIQMNLNDILDMRKASIKNNTYNNWVGLLVHFAQRLEEDAIAQRTALQEATTIISTLVEAGDYDDIDSAQLKARNWLKLYITEEPLA